LGLHRRLGIAGAALAALMIVIGPTTISVYTSPGWAPMATRLLRH
jgi:hypothetical protein